MSRDRRRTWSTLPGKVEQSFLSFVERYSLQFLRYSLVVVFLWFGVLTAVGFGDTAELVVAAFGVAPSDHSLLLLGGWEVATGLALLDRRTVRLAVLLVVGHVIVTLAPLVVFPNETFISVPFAPSFAGVYIIKNWVLLGAVMTVAGEVDNSFE